jgi:hypothetical protein
MAACGDKNLTRGPEARAENRLAPWLTDITERQVMLQKAAG